MKCAVSGNYGSINGGFTSKFFSSINASTMAPSLDLSNAIGLNRVVGWAGTWMGNDPRDLKNAKNIFIWGNNITDAQIHEWHFVADAIEAGSNVIVVDRSLHIWLRKRKSSFPSGRGRMRRSSFR